MNAPVYQINIVAESDVGLVREATTNLAEDLGFEMIAIGELTLAVSEMAQNAFRHGGGGQALIYSLKNGKVIRIIISDEGDGIENIDLAMREGFSTIRTSLGIGLEAAQRLVDKFEIKSATGKGTTVVLEKYLPMTTDFIEYGVVSVPDEQYNFNGDEFLIREFEGDKVLLAVIDGCGQGYDAYAISTLIKKFLEKNYAKPLDSLIYSCDQLLKDSELSGGAAVSLAILAAHQLTYLGVGDTHGYLLGKNSKVELRNFDGRVGEYQLPTLSTKTFDLRGISQLVLCTDGIATNVSEYKFDYSANPQQLANTTFDLYHKSHGDVTVLTAQIKSTI
ncbi:MAG: ATP-binding protein [Bacteroidota bacterium]